MAHSEFSKIEINEPNKTTQFSIFTAAIERTIKSPKPLKTTQNEVNLF